MKFGPVPLDEGEGHILAHSIRLPKGRIRKGVVLTFDHLDQLRDIGLSEITVARLEEGDVHEDTAAQKLANSLLDGAPHMHLSAPFTGRVNLLSESSGVVRLDPTRITAANAVDPMITVATVPPYHQVITGGMIATVKIISYGVDVVALKRACDLARGAITLATPMYTTASLILTKIAGGPGTKGADSIEYRVTGLGATLTEVITVPHEEAALAEAMTRAKGQIILVLTGSATSDIGDTGPQALMRAGGQMTRFGIPVDPGNLLFLGQIGDRPVIGLPGSARSPVLHGADWVLSRVACGVPITDEDFAAMGVGGLLKEIPTRPQPRRERSG